MPGDDDDDKKDDPKDRYPIGNETKSFRDTQAERAKRERENRDKDKD